MDLSQMGKLLELSQNIDLERMLRLSEQVDIAALAARIAEMDESELVELSDRLQEGTLPLGGDGGAPAADPLLAPAPMAYAPFRTAAVLGAGTMGAQIAAHLANAGLAVRLLDVTPEEIGQDGPPNALVERGFKQATKLTPDPFFSEAARARVRLGNFRDDFDQLRDVDWVIEAVVERMDVKQALTARLEAAVGDDTVVSTNTSGLPIGEIAEGRSADFRRRFLGTHFFNPPRYLKLLELIPTADTDPDVLARVAQFGRIHLGKGIVVAKDVPYFIGNRVGVFAMMTAMQPFLRGDYSIEEVDALTGPLVGRPKSATFRTADVVGLDVMRHVGQNLYEKLTDDPQRERFEPPALLDQLVEGGALGAKTRAGFYKKDGKEIKSIDPASGDYTAAAPLDLGDVEALRNAGDLPARLRALYDDEGRAGAFFRETTLETLAYTAARLGEVSDDPADVDRAIRWGFGWELGPFQIWDALGVERVVRDMEARGLEVPAWVGSMLERGVTSFYEDERIYRPEAGVRLPDLRPSDERGLAAIRVEPERTLWKNDEAALLDLGEGVALYEFRSKANTLGRRVIGGLVEMIDRVEADPDVRGLVVGNEGSNFSVGANLMEAAGILQQGNFDGIDQMVRRFQEAMQRVRYAAKPVVAAVHGRVLGGACELAMSSPHPVAAAESYLGLVELGVGLIPAGTGTTRLAALAARQAPTDFPSHIQPFLQRYFENVAMAKVATSAEQAVSMGYLAPHAHIVMNAERRFSVARDLVVQLSSEGYRPPATPAIRVLGRPAFSAFEIAVDQYRMGHFISEYDAHLALAFARVLTGGDLSAPQEVPEAYLLDLEREVFLQLVGDERTQARIEHLLKTGKPLRN